MSEGESGSQTYYIFHLNDIVSAVEEASKFASLQLNLIITVINAINFLPLMKMAGEYFLRQVREARFAILSSTQLCDDEKIEELKKEFHRYNPDCPLLTATWDEVDALYILAAAEERQLSYFSHEENEECEHIHHKHHEHEGHCDHNHMADEFSSFAFFPKHSFTSQSIKSLFDCLSNKKYGQVFRAKGFLPMENGGFELVEYVYGKGTHKVSSYNSEAKFIVIGKHLQVDAIIQILDSL